MAYYTSNSGVSGGSSRGPRRSESTQAYGSPSYPPSSYPYGDMRAAAARSSTAVYQAMDRAPAKVSELNNSSRAARREEPQKRSGLMRRMFEKLDDGSSSKPTSPTRPVISAPSAPHKAMKKTERNLPPGFTFTKPQGPAPPRPTRPPVALSPLAPSEIAAAGLPPVPPELAALKAAAAQARAVQQAKPPVIKRENLGTAELALRGNPVYASELAQARKAYNRKMAVVAGMQMGPGSGFERIAELPANEPVAVAQRRTSGGGGGDESVKAARRRGMVFDPKALTSFPEPTFSPAPPASELEVSEVIVEKTVEVVEVEKPLPQVPSSPKPQPEAVPTIVVTEPTEPHRKSPVVKGLLTADFPYRRALRRERQKAEQVAAMWEPVGQRLAEASGGAVEDPTDTESLGLVLEQLADDSSRYRALLPALERFAHDRHVDPNDEGALAAGICEALATRNEAVAAAAHHKRKAKALEAKLAALMASPRGEIGVAK